MSIHSTAIVSSSARIGADVTIGPYAIVEDDVEIGDGCVIEAAAQVRRGSILGSENRIGSGALIGADPQFLGFDSSIKTETRIGDRNVLREYVTIHRSFESDGKTELGDDNYLMTGAHLGHDCRIGNDNTVANNVLFAGHVTVGDHCFIGGASVFHQFVRVGDYVMAQGMTGVSLDLPPYVISAGINMVAGINSVGLRRAGFDASARKEIKELFRFVYRSEKTLKEFLEEAAQSSVGPEAQRFIDFLEAPSRKGICAKFGSP